MQWINQSTDTMNRTYPILLILAIFLSGCIITDELFLPPAPEQEEPLQDQVQAMVEKHLASQTKGFKYVPYGFSEILITKPQPILELETLEAEQKKNPEANLDSAIQAKRKFIRENDIQRTVSVDHFYTLEDDQENITVIEDRFYLNDTLKVLGSDLLLMTEIPPTYEDVLVYYFYEYTIFLERTYEESKKLSQEFYAFFKQRLEALSTIRERSNFLLHTLELCYYVKQTGHFDQQYILEYIVQNYIQKERRDIQDYEPIDFSILYEQSEEGSTNVLGYYFFHKFIGTYGTEIDTNVIMVEFSPWYELGEIYQMDRPYDQYFK